jgi:hypothetical protein
VETQQAAVRPEPASGDFADYLSPLTDLGEVSLDQHAERFAQVHERLQGALTEIDASG